MFCALLFCFSQAKKRICICNNKCSPLCSSICFNASSDSNFTNFLISNIKDEKEIELSFYSKTKKFAFTIDISNFLNRKVTLRATNDSKDIFLNVKGLKNQKDTKIKVKPYYKIELPDLTPIAEEKNHHSKSILQTNAPISSNIPISVGLHQLEHTGEAECENGHTEDSDRNKNIKLSSLGRGTTPNCRCPITNFDKPVAYKCGYRCWGTASYSYRFKGVQFALYGTKAASGLGKFYVKVDDKPEEEVNEKIPSGRQDYYIIYTSDLLEYKEHSINIYSKGDTYELYKLVYWPTLTAKRLNHTSYKMNANSWNTETDGIGGYRTYKDSGGQAIIKLHCTRFWIYGIMDKNYPKITINYNGKEAQNSTLSYDNKRRENVLVYESPEFEYSSITVNLRSEAVLILYCIYYDEPPSPSRTPIPISIGFSDLEYENTEGCGTKLVGSGVNVEPYDNYGCTTNFDDASSYQCGIRCWGNKMKVSYTFKGVKFGLFGKYESSFGKFNINLDGVDIATVNANAPELKYTILYESDVYIYKEHRVVITSNNKYELYKLVFWPSLKAERLNCTQFTLSQGYNRESDRVGGVRDWFGTNNKLNYYEKQFSCSRFWIYGLVEGGNPNIQLTYDGKTGTAIQTASKRIDCALEYDSYEFEYKSITLRGECKNNLMLHCVYYHVEPSEFEYVDKIFNKTLPYFQILVTPNSIIKRISGCRFQQISEQYDYFITLEKDVSFYDNTFEYISSDNEAYALPIKIQYNSGQSSFLTIRNCNFTQATKKNKALEANVFYCSSSYSINVDFQSCIFDNCGRSSSENIIQIQSQNSFLKMNDCTFQFTNPIDVLPINSVCSNADINNCRFIKTGLSIIDQIRNDVSLPIESNRISVTHCTFDSIKPGTTNSVALELEIRTTSTIIFEGNTIRNIKITVANKYSIDIDGNDKINQIEFKNITFKDNSCESYWGGGSGMNIYAIPNVIFTDCNFINNEARKSTSSRHHIVNMDIEYYNGDGGGFQIGFFCLSNKADLKFNGCTFRNNRAAKHGGALAIQTLRTVEINDCLFESNKANYHFSSSANLLEFENHFNKKTEGRAGAIYINPSYYYPGFLAECSNTDDYMKKVLITNCKFLSNSAYDGYAIYVEGDKAPTEFEINSNTFDDNYNHDQTSANNDPSITIRGVIATEIHTISTEILKQNNFSNVKSKKLIYVDYYGVRMPTDIFSYSQFFSNSEYFSHSEKFTNSDKFTHTDKFSKSEKFSQSNSFTDSDYFPSVAFTKSIEFSSSLDFTISSIFSYSQDFSSSRQFSGTRGFSMSNKFSYSKAFSNSDKFSSSNDFTISSEFTESQDFSISSKFTNSFAFSSSSKFSMTREFSISDRFSESQVFSKSAKFSDSQDFSKSSMFSQSQVFSSTNKFTETGAFSKTEGFTLTSFFSQSTKFTESQDFSSSQKFSTSKMFSFSGEFSKSHAFSNTEDFTNSFYFSKSQAFSASEELPDVGAQCAVYIDGNFSLINNCDFTELEGRDIFVKVISVNFTNFQKDGDGSCIHLFNCGFLANQTNFIDCESTSKTGGGGAIYINNSMSKGHLVTFIDLYFLRCKAAYGGAAFLYSSSEQSNNSIIRCEFIKNEAYAKKSVSDEYNFLYGGGALFLMSKKINTLNCSFHKNRGSSAVKIWNLFDNDKLSLLDRQNENFISFIGCEFEKDEKSKSLIDYIDENDVGNKLKITNCNFKGKLKDGSNYINGLLKDKNNVHLDSCMFENDDKNALNFNLINERLEVGIDNNFRLNKISFNFWKIIILMIAFTALLSLISLKQNLFNKAKDDNEMIVEP